MFISFLFPFLFLMGISLTNSIAFKKKFEYVLPVAIMECLIIIYLTGFFNLLIGFIVCVLLSLISIPLLYYTNKKNSFSLQEYFLTDLFWVFLCVYIFVFIINLGKDFSHWDEYSHWGVMVKELFRLNKYYYLDESVLEYHKDYPPLAPILEYLWCRICFSFKEQHLYNGKIIFSLSLFFPIISSITKNIKYKNQRLKHFLYIFLLSAFIITLGILINVGEASFYRTIYVETILTVLYVYGIFILISKETNYQFSFLNIILTISCLLLTKQIAIYFVFMLFLLYLTQNLFSKKITILKNKIFYLRTIVGFGFPLILWKFWGIAVSANAPAGQFNSSKFNIQRIILFLNGTGERYQYETLKSYLYSLLHVPIMSKPFSISYAGIIALLIIFFLFIYWLEKDFSHKKQLAIVFSVMLIGALGYIIIMLISYLYGFSVGESTALACYGRYMATMAYPILLIIVLYLLETLIRNHFLSSLQSISIILITLFVFIIPFSMIKNELLPGVYYNKYGSLFEDDSKIINNMTPENSRLIIISQGDNGSVRNIIAYKTNPRRISTSYYSLGKPYNIDDIYTQNITVEQLIQLLKDYDYIYLSDVDKQFIDQYSIIFEPNTSLNNQQLYKISSSSNSSIYLEKIY